MGHKILHRKQKYKQWATKYYTENTNNGQQNTIQKRLFEQKHKQWSTKYNTKNDYLSKNKNKGQQKTIKKNQKA
jgi:hypothetical protein